MPTLVDSWYRQFGTAPADARRILDVAVTYDPEFLRALLALGPDAHVPRKLSTYLSRIGFTPMIAADGNGYVFHHDEEGWRLRRVDTETAEILGEHVTAAE